jgi:pimeloyl-ACP methyl ester carboxylesterase
MATFILVHGTWARDAHWPALRDGLVIAASAAAERCSLEELRWSGKNRTSARLAAATEIFSLVRKIHSTSKDERIFIIGHSHGGSAIAYFLKEYPSLAKTLSGCAFLSTPFIAIRPRVQATLQFYLLSFFLLYAFSSSYPYLFLQWFGGDYLSNALSLYPSSFLLAAAFWAPRKILLAKSLRI